MIEYKRGDILKEHAEALVNTVNCVGIMGRGIALQFKKTFPENFKAYAIACKHQEVQPGKMFVYSTGQLILPRVIINFPTKRHWKGKSRIEDINAGLVDLVNIISKYNIKSIAIPALGSGLGGLDWNLVRSRIEATLGSLEALKIVVYEPTGAPAAAKMDHCREVPKMTAGRAALVELVRRYLSGLLDPFVTLLEIHKLMYFLQEAGEPLQLKYQKGHYGPYAENLRHVMSAIEGHLIHGYADGGDSPGKQISLVPGAIADASEFLNNHGETRRRFEMVSQLVEGFESPFGLELLSTVHWILKNEPADSVDTLIDRTYAWSEHKRKFSKRQITIAAEVLGKKGWLDKKATLSI
ncbi:MAG: hypothetical protein ACD_35C00035G0003 [uncultured bacterium]|nr:MAG: hypothetical protein ACD_35C00035G0003 [uncultured bacterium]